MVIFILHRFTWRNSREACSYAKAANWVSFDKDRWGCWRRLLIFILILCICLVCLLRADLYKYWNKRFPTKCRKATPSLKRNPNQRRKLSWAHLPKLSIPWWKSWNNSSSLWYLLFLLSKCRNWLWDALSFSIRFPNTAWGTITTVWM